MKQTAVEWLQEALSLTFEKEMQFEGLFQQAKELEKQQREEFAIGFAEWLIEKEREHPNRIIRGKRLLEIYKKEKGL
jgi:hypothetical protein